MKAKMTTKKILFCLAYPDVASKSCWQLKKKCCKRLKISNCHDQIKMKRRWVLFRWLFYTHRRDHMAHWSFFTLLPNNIQIRVDANWTFNALQQQQSTLILISSGNLTSQVQFANFIARGLRNLPFHMSRGSKTNWTRDSYNSVKYLSDVDFTQTITSLKILFMCNRKMLRFTRAVIWHTNDDA